jgi:hypothetical protein
MTDLFPVLGTPFIALLVVAVWLLARLVACHEERLAALCHSADRQDERLAELEDAARRREEESHAQRKGTQSYATPQAPHHCPDRMCRGQLASDANLRRPAG